VAKAKTEKKKLKRFQVEIDLLDLNSIREGLKKIKRSKIAMPWQENRDFPPCYFRLAAPNNEQIAIVDPKLGGYTDPHEPHGWGWKSNRRHWRHGPSSGWRGICKTAEEAKTAADQWLKAQGFTLLED